MPFIFAYNFELQVLAAFVIFLFGYLAFLMLLVICLFIATGAYEAAKWIQAYVVTISSPGNSALSDIAPPAQQEKSSIILAWTHRLIGSLVPGR
jgi:hypothetical protein